MLRTAGATALGLALLAILAVAGNRNRPTQMQRSAVGIDLAEAPAPSLRIARSMGAVPPPPVAAPNVILKDSSGGNEEQPPLASPAFDPQKLIWTGRLTVEVGDAERATAELEQVARDLGGFLTGTSMQREASGVRHAEVVMRIPAEEFRRAGGTVRALGKVLSESSNVEDVSKAYADLEAHLKVKREAERRVRDLLAQRAGTLKEVLEAEKELARIRGEVDTMEGERRWYAHQVRYSNVTVYLQEPVPIGLSRPSAWASLGDAFRDSAGTLADSLAVLFRGLVYLLPWALVVLLAAYLVRRYRRAGRPLSQAVPNG
jgi:hypothetical protein